MSDHNPDEYLPVESAGNVAGISARTLRYWIKGGKLPAIAGNRGKLVRLGDVLDLADLTGKPATTNRQAAGNTGNPARSAGNVADHADLIDVAPPGTVALPESFARDWIALVRDYGDVREDLGRVTAERDHLADEVAERDAEIELLRAIIRGRER